jgi:hypothetical protein
MSPTATRVMRARRDGTVCPRCRTVIIGQPIGKVPGLGWVHVACLVRRQSMIGPHQAPNNQH